MDSLPAAASGKVLKHRLKLQDESA
jgi:hypothetical protein